MSKPSLKTSRRTIQISVAVAFVLIPFLNRLEINLVYGNFLSFNAAGLPLADPLAVLQVALKNWPLSRELLIGGGIALVIALGLGTIFCSWVCPFGLLSEGVHEFSRWVLPKKYAGWQTRSNGFPMRMGIFGLGLLAVFFIAGSPVVNQLSMPGWYSRIFQLLFIQKHVSLAIGFIILVLLGEFLSQNRLWCRYLCPQAFLLIIAKLVNPFRLKVGFIREKCLCHEGSEPCHRACSLSLDPKALTHPFEAECNNCGDCVVTCKKLGKALSFHLRGRQLPRPTIGKKTNPKA